MRGLTFAMMELGEMEERKAPNSTGNYSESLCAGQRDARLPSTPEATEAAIKAFGEGSLQSGLSVRVPFGDSLRVDGLRGEPSDPRFTMWGEGKLPDYERS